MPLISVVVPIYNVEGYLGPCLESVASQSVDDLEIVMVDDGSTDNSGAIAREWAARDPRFKLITQANGGLSAARNTGIEAAQGEYLAFLDSDDMLAPDAYRRLLGALQETKSDFSTGNVHRLTSWGTSQARFLAKTFAKTQFETHVMRFPPLLADRTAWNKLFRRSFWDAHGWRFPEGVVHEDIPITIPAHFAARSVDVIAEPVYLYRMREDGALSITQRRLEPRVLLDRLAAIEKVTEFLRKEGSRKALRWYHASVVADDLSYHLNILDRADDEYRELFLDRVNAFLDTASDRIYKPLPAIDRLKWHLVRERRMDELVEVLRFEAEDLENTPPVKRNGRWYGDYPFRGDERLAIPDSVYRLGPELGLTAQADAMYREGDTVRVRGYAYIDGIPVGSPGDQKVTVLALRAGPLRRLRIRALAKKLPTKPVERPDATGRSTQALVEIPGSGFEATIDARKLRVAGRPARGTWELYAYVRAGRVRRRARLYADPPYAAHALDMTAPRGFNATILPRFAGSLAVDMSDAWLTVREHRITDDGKLELTGDLSGSAERGKIRLELARRGDGRTLHTPIETGDGRFTIRLPLGKLRRTDEGVEGDEEQQIVWVMTAVGGGRRLPLRFPGAPPGAVRRENGREIALSRTQNGEAAFVDRTARPVLSDARWTDGGVLEVTAIDPAGDGAWDELLLVDDERGVRHPFPAEPEGGGFRARLTPAAVTTLAGTLPLHRGSWRIYARAAGSEEIAPVAITQDLLDRLPMPTRVGHKSYSVTANRDASAVLAVSQDLDDDERGPYNQRHLAETVYEPRRRSEPLRDVVVYMSFGGRQCSDSPRTIYEELVRRGLPLEHVWAVRDGQCAIPEEATVVRAGSREHFDVLSTARWVIINDHFPEWFDRRADQICVQTWHGTPLKRLGRDVPATRRMLRRFDRRWERQVHNWQYVLSPNPFSTPILRGAYDIEGEMLETGYPRVDPLAGPDRDELGRRLRARLGLPEDKRIVLYAPTYRDQVRDRRGRFRLDLRLDFSRLRAASGEDTIVLFRKHHYVVDAVPDSPDGFVRDVSAYPDGTELMLAADVLVTDYSSMMVDFANTGRPMLFYTYDLDIYRDEIRGFYLEDFEGTVPGPLLRTTDEVAEALNDLDGVRAAHAERYRAFRETFCALDDGYAAARVIDRLFAS